MRTAGLAATADALGVWRGQGRHTVVQPADATRAGSAGPSRASDSQHARNNHSQLDREDEDVACENRCS